MNIRTPLIAGAFVACAALLTPLVIQGQGKPSPAQPAPAKEAKAGTDSATPATEGEYTATLTAETQEVRLMLRAYEGPIEVSVIQDTGTNVDSGDVLATVMLVDIDSQIERADKIANRFYQLQININTEIELLQAGAENRKARAELDALAATGAYDRYRERGSKDAIRLAELEAIGIQDSIEDQQEELAQLKELYKGNDLAKESQDIVIRRSERRLARTVERQGISAANAEKVKAMDVPNQLRSLQLAAEQAAAALENWEASYEAREAELFAKSYEIEAAIISAQKAFDDLCYDRDTAATIVAPRAGIFVHGTLKDNDGLSPSIRAHDRIQKGAVIGTIIDASTLRARVMREQAFAERTNNGESVADAWTVSATYPSRGNQAVEATLLRQSRIARDGKVAVELEIDNFDGDLAPGGTIKVRFVPAKAGK